MKVIVLCIDGLEASLVKKWNLTSFMQKVWGIHDVSLISSQGKLYTPILWAAFLLGENPQKYGFTYESIANQKRKAGYGLLYPLYCIRRKILGNRKLGLRQIMVKLGLFSVDRIRKRAKYIERLPSSAVSRTLIHEARKKGYKVWVREFPSYNDDKVAEMRAYMNLYFETSLKKRLDYLEDIYSFSLQLFEDALNAVPNHDLVLYYTPVIDYANHMLYRPRRIKLMFHLARFYRRIEKLVKIMSARFGDKAAILIVSDHGYDPSTHYHSDYGFWSSNVELALRPEKITDFKRIIMELLDK